MHPHYQVVRRACETLGLEPPDGLTSTVEQADMLLTTVDSISASPAELHAEVLSAILSGHDYAKDAVITRLITKHVLMTNGLGEAARQRADSMVTQALADHADGLLSQVSNAVETSADALVSAAQAEVSDLDDATAFAGDTRKLALWDSARTGMQMLDLGIRAAMVLLMAAHVNLDGRNARVLVFSEANADALDAVLRTGANITPWTLAKEGVTPTLISSTAEYQDRGTDLAQQRQIQAQVQEPPKRPSYI